MGVVGAFVRFLKFLDDRQKRLDSVRPELVIEGWHRTPLDHNSISFRAIRNCGKGPAKHIDVHAEHEIDRPSSLMGTIRVSFLAANESVSVDGNVQLIWANAKHDLIMVKLRIFAWDIAEQRHEIRTILTIQADKPGIVFMPTNLPLVHGLLDITRNSTSIDMRLLRFSRMVYHVVRFRHWKRDWPR